MIESSNSPNAVKLRKFEEVLKLCSSGIFIFAIWNIMKLVLQIITEGGTLFSDFGNASTEIKIIIIVIMCAYLLIDTLLRFYIWRLSVKEASLLKKDNLHLVFSVILIIVKVIVFIAIWFTSLHENILSLIIEIILDLMDTALLVAIIVLTIKIRKIVHEREMVN